MSERYVLASDYERLQRELVALKAEGERLAQVGETLLTQQAAHEPAHEQPVAWMYTSYEGDYDRTVLADVEFEYGKEQPGPGWTPLYLRTTQPPRALRDAAASFHETYCPTCPDPPCDLGLALRDAP